MDTVSLNTKLRKQALRVCVHAVSAPRLALAVVKDEFAIRSIAVIQVLHNMVWCRSK